MLYDHDTQTLIHTQVTERVTEADAARYAAALGSTTAEGHFIRRVELVFMLPGAAEANLDLMRRYGLRCRGFDADGHRYLLHEGARASAADAEDGPVMPVLREPRWPQLDGLAHRPLIAGAMAESGPSVTFAWDLGDSLARVRESDLGARTRGDLEGEAVANLARREVTISRLGEHPILVVEGEWAAEKVLVADFMRELERRLGARMLVVAVPVEGAMMVTSADSLHASSVLASFSMQKFHQQGLRRICPVPLVVSDGVVAGVLSTEPTHAVEGPTPEPPAAKPWWRFW